ncbi:MAG: ACP S-malonyltransferase [Acidobacteriota bacterium]
MTSAWLFPGQGSQAVGMGRDLADRWKAARNTFDVADRVLGFSLSQICFEGPDEDLRRTAITQPALLATSVAAARVLVDHGLQPDALAGHSLGEYTALVMAGVLSFEDAVRAVHLRGTFMQEAVPEGQGAMAAVVGLEPVLLQEACEAAAEGEVVSPANLNAPGQIVIAGQASAVRRATQEARQRGARKVIALNVSAPFHCALMEPAARRLQSVLAEIDFGDARWPVWCNVDARPRTAGTDLRQALVRQVTAPVRWSATMEGLVQAGAERFLEVGPGTVLAGLLRRTCREARAQPAGRAEAVAAIVAAAS